MKLLDGEEEGEEGEENDNNAAEGNDWSEVIRVGVAIVSIASRYEGNNNKKKC